MRYLPLFFLLLFSAATVLLRLLPHPANFAPVAALALFTGTYCTRFSRWMLIVPIGAMVISDIFIGTYDWRIMSAVYGSFLVVGAIGIYVGKHKRLRSVLFSSISASIIFYLTTNFAVWLFGTLYPATLEGLQGAPSTATALVPTARLYSGRPFGFAPPTAKRRSTSPCEVAATTRS